MAGLDFAAQEQLFVPRHLLKSPFDSDYDSRDDDSHEGERRNEASGDEATDSDEVSAEGAPSSLQIAELTRKYAKFALSEDFIDDLRDCDDDLDVTDLAIRSARVIGAFVSANPTMEPNDCLAHDLRRAGPMSDEDIAAVIIDWDVELRLTVPDTLPHALEEQRVRREALEAERAQRRADVQAWKRGTARDALGEDVSDDDPRIDWLIEVVDAFSAANIRPTLPHDALSSLGEDCQGATTRLEIAQICAAKYPELSIPPAIDPEGAERQAAAAEAERRLQEEATRATDQVENQKLIAQTPRRTAGQQQRAARLVGGAESLVGSLRWCSSGHEHGALEQDDIDWYDKHDIPHPPDDQGRGDPRGHQRVGPEHNERRVDNAFADWLRRDPAYDPTYRGPLAPEPTRGSHMNCWEAVFFAAYKAGLVSKAGLIDIWREAKRSASTGDALMRYLGYPTAAKYKPGMREPEVGDILFVDKDEHVAICKGNGRYLQLWHNGQMGPDYHEDAKRAHDHRESPMGELDPTRRDIRFGPSPF